MRAGPLHLENALRGNAGYDATQHRTEYADNLSTPTTVRLMTQDVVGFMATLQEILRSDLSDGAKLAAVAEAMGISSPIDVCKLLGKCPRTIERYRAEIRSVRQICPTNLSDKRQECPTEMSDKKQKCPTNLSVSRVDDNIIYNNTQGSIYNITPPSPPTPENPPSTVKPRRKGSRLAEDWTLPDDWRAWTAVNCPAALPEQITREALKFANFWQAKPGSQACKLDWRKTWQNWCLTAFATAPLRPTQGYQSAAERKREGQRNTMAILDSMIAGAVQ